jgi:glycosyltransferase involved in cell wall biosynthesis
MSPADATAVTAPAARRPAAPAAPQASDAARGGGRPLRIEMVLPTLAAAGMEVMVANMTLALAARGHRLGVTCLDGGGPLRERLEAAGIAVTEVPTRGVTSVLRAPALRAHLARLAPDVVHAHSGVLPRATPAARAAGVPAVVSTFHGFVDPEPRGDRAFIWWSAQHAGLTVAVSEHVRQYLLRAARVPASRLATIVNGVDTHKFRPGPRDPAVRRRHGLPVGRRLVGIVARLEPIKNHRVLVDAFARIAAAHPDADLVLVGDGSQRAALEAQAAAAGVGARVHVTGVVGDTPPVYRELDAFVLCSQLEGTPMSVLEAMATAVPVVSTAVGGIPHLVDGGACGRLVPRGDAPALAGAIAELLAAPGDAARLGALGRARAEAHLSESAMLDAYEAAYATLLRGRRAGRRAA